MTDHFKDVLSTQSNYFLPLKDHFSYFLFGGGSLRKSQELSLCSIFKMLVSKYLYGQWLIRINTKKIIWGGCEGLSPLKPQSRPKMVFLTASSRLSNGNKIEKNILDIFSTISDHFQAVLSKSSNYPSPLAVARWDWGFRGLSPSQRPQIIFLIFILISHCPHKYFDANILKIEHKLSSWDFLKDPPPNKKYEK